MTDIVERLRDYDPTRANSREAAAEIERLRAENESLRRALDVVPGNPTSKDIEWARAALEPKP